MVAVWSNYQKLSERQAWWMPGRTGFCLEHALLKPSRPISRSAINGCAEVQYASMNGTGIAQMKQCFLILACIVLVGCERPVFEVVGGSGVTASDLKDRWLVINYWATWCGPCITEIPEFNEIHHDARSDLIVLGVNFDAPSDPSMQLADLEKMKIEFPVVIQDPAGQFGYEVPSVLPTTVIVRPDGGIAAKLVGPQTKASVMQVLEAS